MNLNWENVIEQTIAGLLVLLVAGIIAYFQRKTLGKYLVSMWKWTSGNWHPVLLLIIMGIASWILFSITERLLTLLIPLALVLITFLITKSYLRSRNYIDLQFSKPSSSKASDYRIGRFSQHLDEIIKLNRFSISSLGLRFLNALKKAPPFLDVEPDIPILSLEDEQILTEYFRALDFIKERGDDIRGGLSYTVVEGDDFASIAQKAYGDSKYKKRIEEANPHILSISGGMNIMLPRIDISNPDTSSSLLDLQVFRARWNNDKLQSVFLLIKKEYGLLDEEVIPLLDIAYRVAQITMNE